MNKVEKLKLRRVELEITRRCNLYCEHCYCGDAQPVDMPFEVFDRLLDQAEINKLRLIGGEPLLDLPFLVHIADELQKRDETIGSIGLTTNGTIFSKEHVEVLNKINKRCTNPKESRIYISTDRFHLEQKNSNGALKKYKKALNFDVFPTKGADSWVGPVGRATGKDYAAGYLHEPVDCWGLLETVSNSEGAVQSNIYITAYGAVLSLPSASGCPFEENDKSENQMGNLLTSQLVEMINSWNQSEDIKVMGEIHRFYKAFETAYRLGICSEDPNGLKIASNNLFISIKKYKPIVSEHVSGVLTEVLEKIVPKANKRIVELEQDFNLIYNVSLQNLKNEFPYMAEDELIGYAKAFYAYYRVKDVCNPRSVKPLEKYSKKYLDAIRFTNKMRSKGKSFQFFAPVDASSPIINNFEIVRTFYA